MSKSKDLKEAVNKINLIYSKLYFVNNPSKYKKMISSFRFYSSALSLTVTLLLTFLISEIAALVIFIALMFLFEFILKKVVRDTDTLKRMFYTHNVNVSEYTSSVKLNIFLTSSENTKLKYGNRVDNKVIDLFNLYTGSIVYIIAKKRLSPRRNPMESSRDIFVLREAINEYKEYFDSPEFKEVLTYFFNSINIKDVDVTLNKTLDNIKKNKITFN